MSAPCPIAKSPNSAATLEVDIAVDLKGFTRAQPRRHLRHRAAPIQVSYLGYPGTMGAMPSTTSSPTAPLIPESSQHHYSEKIVYLPDTFQANDSTAASAPPLRPPRTRAGEGLPETASSSAASTTLQDHPRRLRPLDAHPRPRPEGSVLWLLDDNPWAAANLRQRSRPLRGIDPGRLIFAKRVPLAEHLARQPSPASSSTPSPTTPHTTASDALWAGLPVLTRMGQTFAGRVAASLLRAMSLPEPWPNSSPPAKPNMRRAPSNSPRSRTPAPASRTARPQSPHHALFDTAAFTRHLEAAYTAMFARLQSHLPPDHIPHSPQPTTSAHESA
jgi:predicted O-linked N-acetylglucosamine transferase (SPINDLY family)